MRIDIPVHKARVDGTQSWNGSTGSYKWFIGIRLVSYFAGWKSLVDEKFCIGCFWG
jgi:hypothetical protein